MAYLVAAILYELQVVLFNKAGNTMASLDADCDIAADVQMRNGFLINS